MKWTLDNVWKNCLEMWTWICKKSKKGGPSIGQLKKDWLVENAGRLHLRYVNMTEVSHDCFFCEYNHKKGGYADPSHIRIGACAFCPGRRVDPEFNCQSTGSHWAYNPKAFLMELERLNAIRLAKKGARK